MSPHRQTLKLVCYTQQSLNPRYCTKSWNNKQNNTGISHRRRNTLFTLTTIFVEMWAPVSESLYGIVLIIYNTLFLNCIYIFLKFIFLFTYYSLLLCAALSGCPIRHCSWYNTCQSPFVLFVSTPKATSNLKIIIQLIYILSGCQIYIYYKRLIYKFLDAIRNMICK